MKSSHLLYVTTKSQSAKAKDSRGLPVIEAKTVPQNWGDSSANHKKGIQQPPGRFQGTKGVAVQTNGHSALGKAFQIG